MDAISFACDPTPGLVSIVVPAYRADPYIGATLASVAAQTHSEWELLVVEDGSTGATEQIVADFARRHPTHRVDYSRNDRNGGVSHTRNVAFARARGEYVALLDADDRWLPQHLARSIAQLQITGGDLAYACAELVEDRTDRPLGVWGPQPHELEDFSASLYHRNFVPTSATVMRRQVLADVGAWDETLNYCEDLDYWLRCLRAGKKFCLVGGSGCLYRKNHQGAATGRVSETLENLAAVIERYPTLPDVREARLRSQVSRAYYRAAHAHAVGDPSSDPSADPARSVPLIFKAWKLRPLRVDYLVKLAKYALLSRFRRSRNATPSPATEPKSTRTAA